MIVLLLALFALLCNSCPIEIFVSPSSNEFSSNCSLNEPCSLEKVLLSNTFNCSFVIVLLLPGEYSKTPYMINNTIPELFLLRSYNTSEQTSINCNNGGCFDNSLNSNSQFSLQIKLLIITSQNRINHSTCPFLIGNQKFNIR